MKRPPARALACACAILVLGCGPADPLVDASVDASTDAPSVDASTDAPSVDAADAAAADASMCVGLSENCEVTPCCDGACCGQEISWDGGADNWPTCMSAAPPGGFCHMW